MKIINLTQNCVLPADDLQITLPNGPTVTLKGAMLHLAHALRAANPDSVIRNLKVLRMATGCSLYEAKAAVDAAEFITPIYA